MKNDYYKLFAISVFLFLLIISVVSLFINNTNFTATVNFLSVPIFLLSLLISFNKYYDSMIVRVLNEKVKNDNLLKDYFQLKDDIEKFNKEKGQLFIEDEQRLMRIEQMLDVLCAQYIITKDLINKLKKRKRIYFWLMTIPLTVIFIILFLASFVSLPQLNIEFISLLSLALLIGDWIFTDSIINHNFDKFATKLNRKSDEIKRKQK